MAHTLTLPVDPADLASAGSRASLAEAAGILLAGGTVAFPTETVYGLGANALDPQAVARIFAAKQRPSWDPLIVHIASEAALGPLAASVSAADRALIAAFWPGPLTLLLPRSALVPDAVTAGRERVGIRMPAHPVARALIEQAGLPLAAPSANSFGRTSPTTARHVLEDLDGRIDAVLDGGATNLGLESTVIDANAAPPVIYRPGMVSLEAIARILPGAIIFEPPAQAEAPAPAALPSPGVGLRHYAPRARLLLVEAADLLAEVARFAGEDGLTGVLLPRESQLPLPSKVKVFSWGEWGDLDRLAQRLFLGLRELDAQGVSRIVCPLPPGGGLGAALRDRLEKAAKTK